MLRMRRGQEYPRKELKAGNQARSWVTAAPLAFEPCVERDLNAQRLDRPRVIEEAAR
jgi:hypothetical protein